MDFWNQVALVKTTRSFQNFRQICQILLGFNWPIHVNRQNRFRMNQGMYSAKVNLYIYILIRKHQNFCCTFYINIVLWHSGDFSLALSIHILERRVSHDDLKLLDRSMRFQQSKMLEFLSGILISKSKNNNSRGHVFSYFNSGSAICISCNAFWNSLLSFMAKSSVES